MTLLRDAGVFVPSDDSRYLFLFLYTYLAATLKNASRLSQRENFRHRLPVEWIKMSAVLCVIGYRFYISFCFCHVFALRVRYTENLYVEKDESWKAVREKKTRRERIRT